MPAQRPSANAKECSGIGHYRSARMRSDDHYSGGDNCHNREKSRFTLLPEQKEEWNKCGGEGSRQEFMLERAFSSYGTTAHFWNGANPAQKTEYVELMDFFKQHATRDDEGDGGEHTEGAKDVFVVANQISKHKVAANSVQQESTLINQGTGIEREDQNTGQGSTRCPGEEYDVQRSESIAE